MMKNGQEGGVTFELTDDEKHKVAHSHGRHLQCELAKCNVHQLVHLVIRLEAGRRKLEHELAVEYQKRTDTGAHADGGLCDRCKWQNVDWLTDMAAEWRNP